MWDGHLESQKNPDRLKRIIHVDRIGVHSTFVYICAGLRVLMILANCFFLLKCLFFRESRRCDDNQQITVSHFGEHKRLHLESSKQNYYINSLRAIIKAIFTSLEELELLLLLSLLLLLLLCFFCVDLFCLFLSLFLSFCFFLVCFILFGVHSMCMWLNLAALWRKCSVICSMYECGFEVIRE